MMLAIFGTMAAVFEQCWDNHHLTTFIINLYCLLKTDVFGQDDPPCANSKQVEQF